MPRRPIKAIAILTCCVGLSACGKGEQVQFKPDHDPALVSALSDSIMVDTDLSSQNHASAAIAGGGPPVIELPVVERSPEAIQAAKEEARRLAGGSLKSAPLPADADGALSEGATAAQFAVSVRGANAACAGKVEYGMSWSLSLPAPLAIYPHGHLQEAAGTERDGCRLRVASFVTPVDAGDVLDYYHTRLTAAGLETRHRIAGGVDLLDGTKGSAAYAVRASKLENGLTRIDLVSNGM